MPFVLQRAWDSLCRETCSPCSFVAPCTIQRDQNSLTNSHRQHTTSATPAPYHTQHCMDFTTGTTEKVKHFPATEALDKYTEMQSLAPKQSATSDNRSVVTKRTFDMTDLVQATQQVDRPVSFPTIDWCTDDALEKEDCCHQHHEMLPGDNDSPSFSTSFYGRKRIRRSGYGCIEISKSLRESLCYLAERSDSSLNTIVRPIDSD